MAANTNSFASLRVPAWHGLGTVIEERVPAMRFMVEAGLGWEVSKQPIFAQSIDGYQRPFTGGKMVVRGDNNAPLGVVGNGYGCVQNRELFEFVQSLGEFDTDIHVQTAGALGAGETVWALAKMDSLSIALGNDKIESYLLLTNGHTGNRRLSVFPTTVRVVCANTLAMADKGRKGATGLSKGFDLKHTINIQDRMHQAQSIYMDVAKQHATTLATFEALANVGATFDTVKDIAEATFGKVPEKGKSRTIAENRISELFQIWESPTSKGLDTSNSLWTALNAVTEWCDHESTVRANTYTQQESRFIGSLLGGSASGFKETAYTYALTKAGIAV